MAKITLAEIPIKKAVKDKDWKNMSSSEKDELLYELCKKAGLIPQDKVYE